MTRSHTGYIEEAGQPPVDVVPVGADEKEPAFGCFGFALSDDALRRAVDEALMSYLGSGGHHSMMRTFGFADREIDLVIRPGTDAPMERR